MIIKKLTGISINTPVGGLQLDLNSIKNDTMTNIQRLFIYLESKRILTNPIEYEILSQCESSVLNIKQNLSLFLPEKQVDSILIACIENMISECNNFLDGLNILEHVEIIYKKENDWDNKDFSILMKSFRKTFRDNINFLSRVKFFLCPRNIRVT